MTDGTKKMREALEYCKKMAKALEYNSLEPDKVIALAGQISFKATSALSSPPVVCNSCNGSGSPMTCTCQPVVEGNNEDFEKACFYYGIEPKVCKVLSTFIDELRGELQHVKWMRENVEKENWGNYEKVVALQAEKAEIQRELERWKSWQATVAISEERDEALKQVASLQSKLSLAVDGLEKIVDIEKERNYCGDDCAERRRDIAKETLAKVKEK